MNRDKIFRDYLTAARAGTRQHIAPDGSMHLVPVAWHERVLLLLERVPVASKLKVVRRAVLRHQAENRRVVRAFVGQLEKTYPGSPIPGEVARKVLRLDNTGIASSKRMLARINREVMAYEAIMALSASPLLETTLSRQLAICRGSSGSRGQSAS
jgi:hypothetical protein